MECTSNELFSMGFMKKLSMFMLANLCFTPPPPPPPPLQKKKKSYTKTNKQTTTTTTTHTNMFQLYFTYSLFLYNCLHVF